MLLQCSASPPTTAAESLACLLNSVVERLHNPSSRDPIHQCPPSARALLPTHPALLVKLAHTKIHSYPFSQVPICWRRLFTDASIREAARIIQEELSGVREVQRDGGSQELGGKRKWYQQDGFETEKKLAGTAFHGSGDMEAEVDWIQSVVRLLDMAVIIAGAPEREETIESLLLVLQTYTEQLEQDEHGPARKKLGRCPFTYSQKPENVPGIERPIARRLAISTAAFEKHLVTGQPLVLQEALTHWPAFHERPWKNAEYLLRKTFGGRRLVPVELGRCYTDEGWGQRIITFKQFMDQYLLQIPGELNTGATNNLGYLAQHDLFTQIPSLRSDISIPDYCYSTPLPPALVTPLASKPLPPKLEEPLLNAWFGPAGTVSPLHTDPYHNILCQVVGKKYVRLYSPTETRNLYPRGLEGGGIDMSNTSLVDVEAKPLERDKAFPLFQKAAYVETILNEGECLYIPVGWWHFIRSLTISFSHHPAVLKGPRKSAWRMSRNLQGLAKLLAKDAGANVTEPISILNWIAELFGRHQQSGLTDSDVRSPGLLNTG